MMEKGSKGYFNMQYDEFHFFFSILYLIYNFHPAEYISVLKKETSIGYVTYMLWEFQLS